ncbi:hypothetical protein M378DRAFT_19222 [Amanita muscaria Koide BX008]|uniref:Uncharacterized protein n=1 Tax=Amanita muscaria (strain Koide BX008) TaxID=946122 RepID=A0A0C2SJJ4_AMAMK|nr:hypothetical protein M378DRAFT_19222 [Amanita muscaria Koide BX008]
MSDRHKEKKCPPERLKKGPDKSRSRSPTPPPPPATTEGSSSSQRRLRSSQKQTTDIASILEDLSTPWEIEPQLHLPMHLRGCKACSCYARHVVNHSRNGGIDLIQKLQHEHWRAQDKYEAQMEELQNENDTLRARIEELERENTRLTEQLQSAPKETKRARPLSFDGKTSVGEESSRNKKSKTSQTKKPAPSKGKGKQRATEEEEEEEYRHSTDHELLYRSDDDEEGFDYDSETRGDFITLQHGIPWQPISQPSLISRLQPEQSTSRVPYQQSTPASTQPTTEAALAPQPPQPRDAENQWHTSLRVRTNGGQPMFAGQMPNNSPSDCLGGPALFRLQGWTNARLNPNGHVSIQEPTHWITNVPGLWLRPITYWGTGQPLQKAQEAVRIPFDQCSYAQ